MHLTLHKKKANRIHEKMSTLIADRLGEFVMGGEIFFFADARDLTLSCSACTDERR